jgi:hypothetical protein
MPFALLLLGLVVGGMCALLGLNTASAANELSRHDLATRDAAIALQVQQLRNDVAASSAPGPLASAAAALGMVPATDPAFLVEGANGSVRVMGSPGAVVYVPPPVKQPKSTEPPKSSTSATKSSSASSSKSSTSAKSSSTTKSSSKSTAPSKTKRSSKSHQPAKPTPTPTTTLPGGPR